MVKGGDNALSMKQWGSPTPLSPSPITYGHKSGTSVHYRSNPSFQGSHGDLICRYCKKPSHTKDACSKLLSHVAQHHSHNAINSSSSATPSSMAPMVGSLAPLLPTPSASHPNDIAQLMLCPLFTSLLMIGPPLI